LCGGLQSCGLYREVHLIRKVVSSFLFLLAQGALAQAPIQNITLSFLTQQNAKPWNAQVRGKLVCGGQTMATLKCCSGDQKSDQWAVGSTHYRNRQMAQTLPQVALTGCMLELGMSAPSGSSWTVSPTATVVYGNGRQAPRTFDFVTLVSKGQYVSKSFGLDLYP
jgi:hypothetical protein